MAKKKKRKQIRRKPTRTSDHWLWQMNEGQLNHTHGEKMRHLRSVGYLTKRGTLTKEGREKLADMELLMSVRKAMNDVNKDGRQDDTDSTSSDVEQEQHSG